MILYLDTSSLVQLYVEEAGASGEHAGDETRFSTFVEALAAAASGRAGRDLDRLAALQADEA